MKGMVTGAAGFIGKHVAHHLAEVGYEVLCLDLNLVEDLPSVTGDFRRAEDLAPMRECEAVCHIGAIGDVYVAAEDPILAYETNVIGTQRVVEAANEYGLERLIYASTWEVCGEPQYQPLDERHPTNPDHPYNISKLAGELAVRSELNEVPSVALRLGTAYGPGMRENAVIPLFMKLGLQGKGITIQGKGVQFRQFTNVADIARAFQLAMENGPERGVYNIVAPEKVTILELAQLVQQQIPDMEISFAPARAGDVPPAEVTSEKARRELGWVAQVAFADGFAELFEEMESKYSETSA